MFLRQIILLRGKRKSVTVNTEPVPFYSNYLKSRCRFRWWHRSGHSTSNRGSTHNSASTIRCTRSRTRWGVSWHSRSNSAHTLGHRAKIWRDTGCGCVSRRNKSEGDDYGSHFSCFIFSIFCCSARLLSLVRFFQETFILLGIPVLGHWIDSKTFFHNYSARGPARPVPAISPMRIAKDKRIHFSERHKCSWSYIHVNIIPFVHTFLLFEQWHA